MTLKNPISFIYDRLYGQVKVTREDVRLFQTKELARLRHVSLSAIPTWTIPTGVCASKFEHSIGVAHLARIVGNRPEFKEISKDLFFAALAHDLGTPPFSHASEYFQVKLTAKNHEHFAQDVIEGGEFASEVKRQGGNINRIIAFVKGEDKPLSDIVNGSIDIDNLDNTLRFGLSIGLLDKIPYSPEELARAYKIKGKRLGLLAQYTNGIKVWEEIRRVVYQFVYDGLNLSAGSMLIRALDFAYREGEINRNYFLMTDSEAFTYLNTKCNNRTRTLIERANRWILYPRVFSFKDIRVKKKVISYILEPDNRGRLADQISKDLKIPPEDVCVYMGKDKGFKKIHLPIFGDGREQKHQPKNKLAYMIQVYIHPKWLSKKEAIKDIVNQ
ncbi:HD domain-containing protein [Candidatus Gottesmanbacteria bacterium]|nr:HD domain-containing protein [Candidatus Gottesmanbacteria bacterium]